MQQNPEQILVIYSVKGTSDEDIRNAESSIMSYSNEHPDIKVVPKVFKVPAGATPGVALGTELKDELTSSIGAIVFLDDLRPNVAYELGFFHGQGRTVLLLTRKRIDSIWSSISDLAGAAVASLKSQSIKIAVQSYLDRLYEEMSLVRTWPILPVPSKRTNLLDNIKDQNQNVAFKENGPLGSMLVVNTWKGVDLSLGYNLMDGAKFILMMKAQAFNAEYTVYFKVRFADRKGNRRSVWLGLTSRERATHLSYAERTFPAQTLTNELRILSAEFNQLLKHGFILGANTVDFVEIMRVRAGLKNQNNPVPIEICFLSIIGIDR